MKSFSHPEHPPVQGHRIALRAITACCEKGPPLFSFRLSDLPLHLPSLDRRYSSIFPYSRVGSFQDCSSMPLVSSHLAFPQSNFSFFPLSSRSPPIMEMFLILHQLGVVREIVTPDFVLFSCLRRSPLRFWLGGSQAFPPQAPRIFSSLIPPFRE